MPKLVNKDDDERVRDVGAAMGYQETLMYGRYSKSLGEYAKEEARKQREVELRRKKEARKRLRELSGQRDHGRLYRATASVITVIWEKTFAHVGEDGVFLALLGIIMAVLSFMMDEGIKMCNRARASLYEELQDHHVFVRYLCWLTLPISLILFSTGFVHMLAPQAVGSGIPEMKTIMRGVVLKEYLSFRTFVAKIVGLTTTLGSGMPLGKEGPFVHIASVVASLLISLLSRFQGMYRNESRQYEMLAAACAVGVACCFGSPIGGVLFSIEVTTTFFAVRNYWRGFFAAVCGATTFRLLAVLLQDEETLSPFFRTSFNVDFPYDPREIIAFVAIGVVCGVFGAAWVYLHRRYVLWMRGVRWLSGFLQRHRFVYPLVVVLVISSLQFPPWLGKYHAASLNTHDQVATLFLNHSWVDVVNGSTAAVASRYEQMVLDDWVGDTGRTGIFFNLAAFVVFTFFGSIVASTLPVPTGVVIPTFKIGAGLGRMVGEAMYTVFPAGFGDGHFIVAGGYAAVGAAGFTGAVTQTLSISVIVFEMTGQITHIIPVLLSVLVSKAIASLLQPSCFDSIIIIKKLPYLPDILPSSSQAYEVSAEDFMLTDVKYVWQGMTYGELREVLRSCGGKKLRSFPLVDNPAQMVLLGSIQRNELIMMIEDLIGRDKRQAEAQRRYADKMDNLISVRQLELRLKLDKLKRGEVPPDDASDPKVGPSSSFLAPPSPLKDRRPSRFEVTAIQELRQPPDSSSAADLAEVHKERRMLQELDIELSNLNALQHLSQQPKKSILKKGGSGQRNAHTIHAVDVTSRARLPNFSTFSRDEDQTVTHHRSILANLFGAHRSPHPASQTMAGLDPLSAHMMMMHHHHSPYGTLGSKRPLTAGYRLDMTLEEQHLWEEEQMLQVADFSGGACQIDPAPFQLVEKTSLLKVHSMFSMLGVSHAYVTAIGSLIGVVTLAQLRTAIENANAGQIRRRQKKPPPEAEEAEKGGGDAPEGPQDDVGGTQGSDKPLGADDEIRVVPDEAAVPESEAAGASDSPSASLLKRRP